VTSPVGKFRITLYALDTSTGWRGSVAATIYDSIEVGIAERANEIGEGYWVLPNEHPSIGECVIQQRHYEIHRYDSAVGSYRWVGAGILEDAEVGQFETVFRGIDYMTVFNQYYTPTVALTFNSTNYVSPDITQDGLSSIFSYSRGTILDGVDGEFDPANAGKKAWYTNNVNLVIDNVELTSTVADTLTIDSVTITTASVKVLWDAVWNGATTTSFPTNKQWRFRLDMTPPASEAPAVPTISGGVWESTITGDTTFAVNNTFVMLYPYESKDVMYQALIAAGRTTAQADATILANATRFALRKGVTYSAIIHGAIYRTNSGQAIPHWIRCTEPKKTDKFTVGSGNETFTNIFDRVFNSAKTTFALSRIRYASRSVSGSPYTTLLTYSAGEPPVTYLANTARLEMQSRTDGLKTIFGISHPSSTGSYDGNFRVRYDVSANAISTIRLSYPENLRGYSYSPGGSNIKTHIRVIPSTPFLAGTASAGAVGVSINGATATTGEATIYGEIPSLVTQAGFVDDFAAQLEADRLADSSKASGTKVINVQVKEEALKPWDGFDLGDAVSLHVVDGNVNIPDEKVNIAGVEWVGYADGHEELNLELIQGTNF